MSVGKRTVDFGLDGSTSVNSLQSAIEVCRKRQNKAQEGMTKEAIWGYQEEVQTTAL